MQIIISKYLNYRITYHNNRYANIRRRKPKKV